MNFSEQTISILDYICNKFGIVIDWTSDNVWPMVEMLAGKYIKWEIASSSIWIFIWLLGFVSCLSLCIKIYKGVNASYGWKDEEFFGFLIFSVGTFGFFCALCSQVFDIARCIAFPELEIFEYLKETLSTMSK